MKSLMLRPGVSIQVIVTSVRLLRRREGQEVLPTFLLSTQTLRLRLTSSSWWISLILCLEVPFIGNVTSTVVEPSCSVFSKAPAEKSACVIFKRTLVSFAVIFTHVNEQCPSNAEVSTTKKIFHGLEIFEMGVWLDLLTSPRRLFWRQRSPSLAKYAKSPQSAEIWCYPTLSVKK